MCCIHAFILASNVSQSTTTQVTCNTHTSYIIHAGPLQMASECRHLAATSFFAPKHLPLSIWLCHGFRKALFAGWVSPACFVKTMCSRPWCLSKCEGAAVHILPIRSCVLNKYSTIFNGTLPSGNGACAKIGFETEWLKDFHAFLTSRPVTKREVVLQRHVTYLS